MKLLVVSHPCVVDTNQAFYAEVERLTGWSLTLVVPASWRSEYGLLRPQRWPTLQGDLLPLAVMGSGNIPLHVYRARFGTLLRRVHPDAIYMHHEPCCLATQQVYHANQATVRAPIGFYAAQNIYKRYPMPLAVLERWVLRRSSFAFPVSVEAETVLRYKGYRGVAPVLPLALDTTVYRPQPDKAALLRGDLGVNSQAPVIGYVGRLVEEKGLLMLLDALSELTDIDWQFVLIGEGPQGEELRKRAHDLGLDQRITFVGYVPHGQIAPYLSLFDLLVLPSLTRPHWKEQFGRVLIEAMACETPVLGSDSGEIPAVIAATGGGEIAPEQ
jgi:glycosyltransferase involved in cell wall biosynthesis